MSTCTPSARTRTTSSTSPSSRPDKPPALPSPAADAALRRRQPRRRLQRRRTPRRRPIAGQRRSPAAAPPAKTEARAADRRTFAKGRHRVEPCRAGARRSPSRKAASIDGRSAKPPQQPSRSAKVVAAPKSEPPKPQQPRRRRRPVTERRKWRRPRSQKPPAAAMPQPTAAQPRPRPAPARRRRARHGRGRRDQRRPAPDVHLRQRRRRRRRSAAATRCGWCSIPASRSMSSRSAARAARSSATSAACRSTRGRRSASASTARRLPSLTSDERLGQAAKLDADLRRQDAAPPQPLMVIAQHHRSRARQHRRALWPMPAALHQLTDPDAGDTLLVVTAAAPVRGFIKRQDFVELSLLESAHGVAIRPNSDDVAVEIAPDKVILGRPGGLTLSSVDVGGRARADRRCGRSSIIDEWRKDQAGEFHRAAGRADRRRRRRRVRRSARRRGSTSRASTWRAAMYAEAKGDARPHRSPTPSRDRGSGRADHACSVANILIGRPGQGAEGPRQSRGRQQLRFAIVEGARLCAAGEMGGRAREIQERRIRDRLAADRAAAHRDHGRDARLARGQGFRRRRQAPQRARRDRRVRPR